MLALVALFLVVLRSPAAPMPEFGPSVEFDRSGPDVSIGQLRGKAVVVLFFQSWCPKCNVWSGELLRQIEEAHGSYRNVVTIAMKTDGGGISGAKSYLKKQGADLSKWLIASDKDGAYYKAVSGGNALWGYALVGSDGDIVEVKKAGAHFTTGADKGKYALATMYLVRECGELESVLPADTSYPSELDHVVRLAELGCFGDALREAKAATYRAKDKDAARGLGRDILAVVQPRLQRQMDILGDAEAESALRYDAYKQLELMSKDLSMVPLAKDAKALLYRARSSALIQKERTAETAYHRAVQKLKNASPRDRERILRELSSIGRRYPDTKYGRLASDENQ